MASSINSDDYFKCNYETSFVNHIVKALRENIIGEPHENHKLLNITVLCLFSGPTPTCEYYICLKLKELYKFKTLNIIFIDKFCPDSIATSPNEKIIWNDIKTKNDSLSEHLKINKFECYNFAYLIDELEKKKLILDKNTFCFALNPEHGEKPLEGIPYGRPSNRILPGHPDYNIHLGMYEFFNTYWLNRKVLYAYRGKPPPIVIFCPTVEQSYEGLVKLFTLTNKNFDINKVFTMNNNNKVLKNETDKYKSNIVNLCLPSISGGSKIKNIRKTKTKTRKNINLHKSKKNRKYKKHYNFI